MTSEFYKAHLAEKAGASIHVLKPLPILALTSDKPFMTEEQPYMTDMYPTSAEKLSPDLGVPPEVTTKISVSKKTSEI